MAATAQQTMEAINSACQKRGGKYATYSCKVVSWDDVSRGTSNGSLSCLGSNITDTYLKSRSGQQLFTVRSDNWNEKLGTVSADDVALIASKRTGDALRPVTLRTFLKELGEYGSYAGMAASCNLADANLDSQCSIRFQTTFLPMTQTDSSLRQMLPSFLGGGPAAKLEFCTEAYNYNTRSDDDPRNLVLLCTTQGVAVQQDGRGTKKLLHHTLGDDRIVHRHWLEAEETRHEVGGPQQETIEERNDALARGKATSNTIGTRAMGQRFNVLMTIQVPLKQKQRPMFAGALSFQSDSLDCLDMSSDLSQMMLKSKSLSCTLSYSASTSMCRAKRGFGGSAIGRSSAARVSKGSEFDTWTGLSITRPERHNSDHITITVVIYNTVSDGVPGEQDVCQAINDMEDLYEATITKGKLADAAFDFMKKPLEDENVQDIGAKFESQPPSQSQENACDLVSS